MTQPQHLNRRTALFLGLGVAGMGASVCLVSACEKRSTPSTPELEIDNHWRIFDTEAYKGKRDTISFIDAKTGWYGTGKGDILETERIYQGHLNSITVIHAAGRVGGPTGILRSVDNGQTWSVIDMTDIAGMILDIVFFSENVGIICASTSTDLAEAEGLILRTEDGGENWQEVYRSGRKGELVWKVSFPDAQHGFATVQSYDTDRVQQLIVKSVDGGRNWVEMPLTQNAKARQFGIGFLDEHHGWVGTFAGGFYTKDGGETFEAVPIAKAANKFQIVKSKHNNVTTVFAIGIEVQSLTIR